MWSPYCLPASLQANPPAAATLGVTSSHGAVRLDRPLMMMMVMMVIMVISVFLFFLNKTPEDSEDSVDGRIHSGLSDLMKNIGINNRCIIYFIM